MCAHAHCVLLYCIWANTSYDVYFKLTENTSRSIAQFEYANAIGSLMYVMHCTRLYIAFIAYKLSRYTNNPCMDHWITITRVLGYLKSIMIFGLFYNNFLIVLEGYINVSWITNASDNK
jgi:hypothetical protein